MSKCGFVGAVTKSCKQVFYVGFLTVCIHDSYIFHLRLWTLERVVVAMATPNTDQNKQ